MQLFLNVTKVLANKLGSSNITVNAIAPGPFQSKMMQKTLELFENKIIQGIPLKRIGKDSDMIGITIFLCSPAGCYLTGTIIQVDGGICVKSQL